MKPPNNMQNIQSNSISQICPINTKRAVYMLNFETLLKLVEITHLIHILETFKA